MHMELDGVAEVALQRNAARPVNVAAATFPIIRRGYDPTQVQWYLQTVAEDLAEHEERSARLTQQVADLQNELAQVTRIDEVTVANFLGEESARLLTMARDTSENLKQRSEDKAANTVAAAKAIAADMRSEVEREVARDRREASEEVAKLRRDAATDTARQRQEAETETRRLRRDTEAATTQLRQETDDACALAHKHAQERADKIVTEAEAKRTGMLDDLFRRRELASQQLRDLMAGRDTLVASLTQIEAISKRLTADLETYDLEAGPFVNLDDELRDRVVVDGDVTTVVRRATPEQRSAKAAEAVTAAVASTDAGAADAASAGAVPTGGSVADGAPADVDAASATLAEIATAS
jgi:DivIVA domain-containing protein